MYRYQVQKWWLFSIPQGCVVPPGSSLALSGFHTGNDISRRGRSSGNYHEHLGRSQTIAKAPQSCEDTATRRNSGSYPKCTNYILTMHLSVTPPRVDRTQKGHNKTEQHTAVRAYNDTTNDNNIRLRRTIPLWISPTECPLRTLDCCQTHLW